MWNNMWMKPDDTNDNVMKKDGLFWYDSIMTLTDR